MTEQIIQPWVEAIYVADDEPIRIGIRRFIYEPYISCVAYRLRLDKLCLGVTAIQLTDSRTTHLYFQTVSTVDEF